MADDEEFSLTIEQVQTAAALASEFSAITLSLPATKEADPLVVIAALMIFSVGQAKSMGVSIGLLHHLVNTVYLSVNTAPTVTH